MPDDKTLPSQYDVIPLAGHFSFTDEVLRSWQAHVILEPQFDQIWTVMCRGEVINRRNYQGDHSPFQGCDQMLQMANMAIHQGADPEAVLKLLIGHRTAPILCQTLNYPSDLLPLQESLCEPLPSLIGRYALWMWGNRQLFSGRSTLC